MGLETGKSLHFGVLRFEVTRCLSENMSHGARDGGWHSEEATELQVTSLIVIVKTQ